MHQGSHQSFLLELSEQYAGFSMAGGKGSSLPTAGRDVVLSVEHRHDLRKGARVFPIYAAAVAARCWVRVRTIAFVISAAIPGASSSGRTTIHSRPPSGTVLKMG